MTEWNGAAFDQWLTREEEEGTYVETGRYAILHVWFEMQGTEPEPEWRELATYDDLCVARRSLESLKAHKPARGRYKLIDRENLGQEVEG